MVFRVVWLSVFVLLSFLLTFLTAKIQQAWSDRLQFKALLWRVGDLWISYADNCFCGMSKKQQSNVHKADQVGKNDRHWNQIKISSDLQNKIHNVTQDCIKLYDLTYMRFYSPTWIESCGTPFSQDSSQIEHTAGVSWHIRESSVKSQERQKTQVWCIFNFCNSKCIVLNQGWCMLLLILQKLWN